MSAPGITVVYAFDYRGDTEEWSQRYHMTHDPTSQADFEALMSGVLATLLSCVDASQALVRAYGYHDTDDDHAFSVVYGGSANPGTFSPATGDIEASGDVAAWMRWDTGRMSHGKKVYLRKYWHGCYSNPSTGPDRLASDYVTALQTAATGLLSPHTGGFQLAGPDGETPTGLAETSFYLTTRTLKRRGARPTPP